MEELGGRFFHGWRAKGKSVSARRLLFGCPKKETRMGKRTERVTGGVQRSDRREHSAPKLLKLAKTFKQAKSKLVTARLVRL